MRGLRIATHQQYVQDDYIFVENPVSMHVWTYHAWCIYRLTVTVNFYIHMQVERQNTYAGKELDMQRGLTASQK